MIINPLVLSSEIAMFAIVLVNSFKRRKITVLLSFLFIVFLIIAMK